MATAESLEASVSKQNEQNSDQEERDSDAEKSQARDSDSDSESEYDSEDSDYSDDYDDDVDEPLAYRRAGDDIPDGENTPELNMNRFTQLLESRRMKKREEEEDKKYVYYEDLFNFPKDPENWTEEDLKELWADAPLEMTKPGWDPVWADEEDWDVVKEEMKAGRDPPIAPFYVPYRKPYPAIPDDHYDVANPKAVVEELDRIEEFLTWVSYIFPDGSSYEGTVWDDLAHGKGVYVAEEGLVRYEGEWLQNNMEGHGVVEVDIPDVEPVPGSKLEEQMRAEGKIISRDYMTPEDKEWLEKDIEDIMQLADGNYEVPFYERDEWIKYFGAKPEVGRYRYAGQWKQGRMHGCGVYEINERTIYGRFYFGELLEDSTGCDEDTSALHLGIAEVAAAKARMFVNKPDGMVREERGPYNDPQHPYFYEEEDVWMAPGFINQFYEVPDYWKTYMHEVDHERELWLNSFYKAPLRLPMPAELEYWWSQDQTPEFVLLNKEPEPDPEDPSKLIYTEDPLILHTPTGRIINYIEDENHGVRLFWQPPLKEGEDVDPEKAEFLPLGFDEFYGTKEVENRENFLTRFVSGVENSVKSSLEKLEKWTEEKKKDSERKMQVLEKELELVEAEICLEEAIEEMDEDLKKKEKEEEEKVEMGLVEKEDSPPSLTKEDEKTSVGQEEEEEDDDDEEEDEDDGAPSSFGSATPNKDQMKNGQKGNKPGSSPFSSTTLSFASSCLVSGVPSKLLHSFLPWRKSQSTLWENPSSHRDNPTSCSEQVSSVNFPRLLNMKESLRASSQIMQGKTRAKMHSNGMKSELHSISQILLHSSSSSSICPKRSPKKPRKANNSWVSEAPEVDNFNILSLHTPVSYLESWVDTTK